MLTSLNSRPVALVYQPILMLKGPFLSLVNALSAISDSWLVVQLENKKNEVLLLSSLAPKMLLDYLRPMITIHPIPSPHIAADMRFVKNFTRWIFRLKILHRQFHLISTVLVRKKNTKKLVKIEKFTPLAKILHCRRH